MEAHEHDMKTIDRLEEENGRLRRNNAALLAACVHHLRELHSADSNRHAEGCECGSCAIRAAVHEAS